MLGDGTLPSVKQLGITYRDAAVLVRARDLMTPIAEALTIHAIQVAADAVRALDHAGFDYAPLLTRALSLVRRPRACCAIGLNKSMVNAARPGPG